MKFVRRMPLLVAVGAALVMRCALFAIEPAPSTPIDPAAYGQYGHEGAAADAPAEGASTAEPGARAAPVVHNGFVSIQVNVDAGGNNIVGDAANEPTLAIDPTDPSRMVIAWRQFDSVSSSFRQAGWAYSHNGGQDWTFPGAIDAGVYRSDPVLAVGDDGTFYFYSLASDYSCQLFISIDSGLSWSAPIDAFGGDKPWMTIDASAGVGHGNLYAAWDDVGCCGNDWFTRSTDGGITFDTPVAIPGQPIWGTVTVGPDGAVYVAGRRLSTAEQFIVAKSTTAPDPQQPLSFASAAEVNLGGSFLFSPGFGPNPRGLLGQVWIVADASRGPRRGHLYMLCSVDPPGPDDLDVNFVRSTDGGALWSPPLDLRPDVPVSGSQEYPWQWFGTLAIAPNGRLDVVWNETDNDPSVPVSQLFYTYSVSGGDTWSPPVAVTPPFNHWLGWPNQFKLGDYYQLISDDAGASLAYAATFRGEQDIYFVRLEVVDCNNNGVVDAVETAAGAFDCNGNRMPDSCDLAFGVSSDCNADMIPDDCQLDFNDCNTNFFPDECDLAAGGVDANQNGILDECEHYVDCNTNGVPDNEELAGADCNGNGVLDECEDLGPDCNTNAVPDVCDLIAGTSSDCQDDGVPDECQLANNDCNGTAVPDDCEYPVADCNDNGVLDGCDLYTGVSADCQGDGVPDECELFENDCNTSGVPDECELADNDCDGDGVPDDCQIAGFDCNTNGVLDVCDIASGLAVDCNGNLRPDDCDIADQVSADCNTDGVPDECQLAGADCNGNAVPDECELFENDCNANVTPDECDIASGISYDCDFDGVPDECVHAPRDCNANTFPDLCDVAWGASADCDGGGVPDECDLAAGTADDCNADGVPDVCQLAGADCNTNGVPDDCDIADQTSADCQPNGVPDDCELADHDCNANAVPDECELADADCNTNGVLDVCDIAGGAALDCNANRVPDVCDIAGGTSDDCDGNLVPDDCELPTHDCNSNGVLDACDIAAGVSADCNFNNRPDECDLAMGAGRDCDSNGVIDLCELAGRDCNDNVFLDSCDLAGGTSLDCNSNATPDECDIAGGNSSDCNLDLTPDECQLAGNDCNANAVLDSCDLTSGSSADCNGNGAPDECDIASGSAVDCNSNGVPDGCDLAAGDSPDCNATGVPDECEVASGTAADCNGNGVPDACDLASGVSTDCDGSGIPDSCELVGRDCNDNGTLDVCDLTSGASLDCNSNAAPDECDVAGGVSSDCDGDLVPDECQIAGADCNGNGVLDVCDLTSGVSADCNANAAPDECDIAAGASGDCDGNWVPDECELAGHDCNANLILDICDIASGGSADCQANATPDECELTDNDCNANAVPDECELPGHDCNANGLLDSCDLAAGVSADCNANAQPDECDIASGVSGDCDGAGVPDECELAGNDCNANGVLDVCDVATGASADCQSNATPDECELAGNDCNGTGVPDECELVGNDCDANGVPDSCDLASGAADDCNLNVLPDVCDIASGTSADLNRDRVPDECQVEPCRTRWTTKLMAGDGVNGDLMGYAVAASGNRVVVGAYGDDAAGTNSGAAYIWRWGGATWIHEATLTPADGAAGDQFGIAVRIDGDRVIIGASLDDDRGMRAGSAYIYHFNGSSWVQEAKLLASNGQTMDEFGTSVGIAGTVAVVGAYGHDHVGLGDGAAYVFRLNVGPPAVWVEEAVLYASDGMSYDYFGRSVAVSDDRVIVGAYGDDDAGSGSGAAYVYRPNGAGWVQQAKLVANDAQPADFFGYSVALSGNVAVVGASGDDDRGDGAGAAYVFRETDGWQQEQKLHAFDGGSGDAFGTSVAVRGSAIMVGAYGDDERAGEAGASFLVHFDGSAWAQQEKLIAADGLYYDQYGYGVGLSDNVAVSGAPYHGNRGAVYALAGLAGDCNGNRQLDVCDVSLQVSNDCNDNSHPDECEQWSPGDFDADGGLTASDLSGLWRCLSGPQAGIAPPAPLCVSACQTAFDLDNNGRIDLRDYALLQAMPGR